MIGHNKIVKKSKKSKKKVKNNKSKKFIVKKMKGGALENEHKLLDAIKDKKTDIVMELIDKDDFNVNFFLPYGNFTSPLIDAVVGGNDEIIKILIEKGGADIYIKNRLGRAAIDYMDPIDYQQFGVKPSYQNKLMSKFTKKGVYELREYNGYYIPITIIPKGTVLFRSTLFDENDFCGVKSSQDEWDGETYCLHKSMNVFFYPYPAYYEEEFKIFVVERTLKIVNLIYPSYLNYRDIIRYNDKHHFMETSDIVEPNFCSEYKGNNYDISFLTDFLRVNGDIAGYIGLVAMDIEEHEDKYEYLNNYSLFHKDVTGKKGIPEIVLYPKQERMLEERIWNIEDCLKEPNNFLHLFDSLDHTINTNEDREEPNIMELLLSPEGYEVDRTSSNKLFVQQEFDRLHVTIYNPLKLYVLWEYLPEEYKKDCVPLILDAKSKLTQFQSDINKLNEGLYKTNFLKFGGKSKKCKTRREKIKRKIKSTVKS